ncbi:hypothetical protein B0T11DRAFT_89120 [Plectosphaerella cucumerina]|uniref:Microsomal glutathione S-transferase 3 n=1 Tax=Plectosphaerella cucumerina TaxID=40658 RepID=A0A8K0TFB9_9PEZI|nr:hypothetical protein B0T11DRAFT_89120 [Plectosphaerella cucumerina]
MVLTLTLPSEFGYVLLVATSSFFVNTVHSVVTSKHRKLSGLKYPIAYASNDLAEKDPKAYKFNCAQRAHNNYTENQISFLGALLISGLRYPVAAAGLGAAWVVARVAYVFGYTSDSGPKGRLTGGIVGSLVDAVLKLTALYTSFGFVMGW